MTDDTLYLNVRNDGQLYRDRIAPLYGKLADQKSAGTYRRDDAVARFLAIVNDAAVKYRREARHHQPIIFSPAERRAAAAMMADYFEAEHSLGNMEWARSGADASKKSKAQLKREIDQVLKTSPGRR